jgi:hypothetical protein
MLDDRLCELDRLCERGRLGLFLREEEDDDLLLEADDLLLDDEELPELLELLAADDEEPTAANSTRSASASITPRLSRLSMGTFLAISATTPRACWASGAAWSDW